MQSVAERGSSSKRPVDRSVPSSSNNEATNSASTPVRGLAIEQPRLDDGLGGMDILIGRETELVEEPRAAVVLMTDEPETRQRTEQAHQSFETNTKSISSSSMMDDVLRMCRNIMSQEYKHSVVENGSSSESPAHKRRRTRRYFLPTTKLEGQAFEKNMTDVWSWLLNDKVSSIGIHGMGGVGKTAFATHIHNQLRHVCQERQDIFHHVCWITVSLDFSIEALQDCIANYFDLDLGDQKDAVVRAGMLLTELSVKKKYVLILDDLWDRFPLEKVGIPLRTDGCKLVFTTRSLDICTKMDCQKALKVEPLSEDEAENLFYQKLGHGTRLFHKTKQIAECLVKECAGLPLGIMTMAGSMKGVDDEYRWRDALRRLRISEVGPSDMETEVFRVLKFSYAQLNDPVLQKCFLHITLFPKGKIIRREDLIEYLIDEGAQLTELPDGTWWRENLLIVSLMENRIKEIPSDFSPRCPNLSTLLLCRNYKLNVVESSFFQHFIRLKVLDLSDTDIEKLPGSICHLTTLTVLLLGWCAKLSYVPSLAELTALKKLDLSYTGLENLPEGMERLKDLRYLNLDGSEVRDLQPGVLPELSKLQFLKLHQKVGGDEVLSLQKLETLECNFDDLEGCMPFLFGSLPSLIACKVTVGRPSFSLLEDLNYTKSKSELVTEAWFYDLMIDNANFLKKISFKKIVIVNCQTMRSLCALDGIRELEILHLDGLMILETLFGAPSDRLAYYIRRSNHRPLRRSNHLPPFCCLKEIVIHRCHRMKVLFPSRLLSILRLEVIVVEDCHNMGMAFPWRHLKVLVLKKLPNLNSIYSGTLECHSLEEITVNDCPQLTRIPLAILFTNLKKNQVDPESLRHSIGYENIFTSLFRRRVAQLEEELDSW
ncbi:disease resistance protein [Salix suchowensis]|nr:disease resistance protein [Salix suchowensis]